MKKLLFLIMLSSAALGTSAGWAQSTGPNGEGCPPASATTGANSGNTAENPASKQGIEHSAILPDAGGENSAAPTIKKDGEEVRANTECPKEPNRLDTPASGLNR
jgi:hypothetical protein